MHLHAKGYVSNNAETNDITYLGQIIFFIIVLMLLFRLQQPDCVEWGSQLEADDGSQAAVYAAVTLVRAIRQLILSYDIQSESMGACASS